MDTGILEHIKINIERLGFWFWFFLFGFLDVMFSIIYRDEYIALGLYFFACGVIGYFISVLLDRISSTTWVLKDEKGNIKLDEKGNKTINPPLYYSFITFTIKVGIFVVLCIFILKKYPEFSPFN